MKRREAIKHLGLVTAGIAILPACNTESFPIFENLVLNKRQYRALVELTEVILPYDHERITMTETCPEFIGSVLDQCYSPEDINTFSLGLQEFEVFLKEHKIGSLLKANADKKSQSMDFLTNEKSSDEVHFFFRHTKRLTIEHMTSSEYYMVNKMEYEYAPGRFKGCVSI